MQVFYSLSNTNFGPVCTNPDLQLCSLRVREASKDTQGTYGKLQQTTKQVLVRFCLWKTYSIKKRPCIDFTAGEKPATRQQPDLSATLHTSTFR